ncbi:MAG TPA: SRPBCC family protein [Cyclobacteriaceae bacterium]|nr:SRPBCC family protein [Cyclobacteriaceae bacterium]
MKILKIIGIILLALVVVLGIVIAMQPAKGHIEKSIVINAAPAVVYRELNGFATMTKWSPWAKMDTATQYVFEGPQSGVGARVNWDGPEVGKGSQWIDESIENQRINCQLKFDGYDGKASATFILSPDGQGTNVVWTYDGANDGITGKAMWLMMRSMMPGLYTQGLVDLKTYIENLPPTSSDSTVMQ